MSANATPDFGRRAVGRPGDAHQPAHRLDERVVAGLGGARSRARESAQRAINEARIDFSQRGEIEPEFVERIGAKVFDQRVGLAGEFARDGGAFGARQIERERFFVAVGAGEVGGQAGGEKRRPPLPGLVAAGRVFDFDDARAEVGENLRRPRPGENSRQIENQKAGQRARHESQKAERPVCARPKISA